MPRTALLWQVSFCCLPAVVERTEATEIIMNMHGLACRARARPCIVRGGLGAPFELLQKGCRCIAAPVDLATLKYYGWAATAVQQMHHSAAARGAARREVREEKEGSGVQMNQMNRVMNRMQRVMNRKMSRKRVGRAWSRSKGKCAWMIPCDKSVPQMRYGVPLLPLLQIQLNLIVRLCTGPWSTGALHWCCTEHLRAVSTGFRG